MLSPGSVIGIMGGGQLGRMTALAAANLGYKTHIYTSTGDSPASYVAYRTTVAAYDDLGALKKFAQSVAVVTFEFENIPHDAVKALSDQVPVNPGWECLFIAQNRLREKELAQRLGFGTASYRAVSSLAELEKAFAEIGAKGAILKTTELGYDGKGQARIRTKADCAAAWQEIGSQPCVLEGFVDFAKEISVVVARNAAGQVAAYPAAENSHENGILRTTTLPADITAPVAKEAEHIAVSIAEHLKLVGLLAIEFFVTGDGQLLVNEMAPRPHNSGHWTMDAAVTSQFEQFTRAVCGLPLGSTARLCSVRMQNLIGGEVETAQQSLKNPLAKLHLYDKEKAADGRKMGHINFLEN